MEVYGVVSQKGQRGMAPRLLRWFGVSSCNGAPVPLRRGAAAPKSCARACGARAPEVSAMRPRGRPLVTRGIRETKINPMRIGGRSCGLPSCAAVPVSQSISHTSDVLVNQSVSHTFTQLVCQPIRQSVSKSVGWSVGQSVSQPGRQPVAQHIGHASVSHDVGHAIGHAVSHPISQSGSRPRAHSASQSASEPLS